jgi:hypothetical protein
MFHHYKELKKRMFELDRLQGKMNSGNSNKDKEQWTIEEEERKKCPLIPWTVILLFRPT